jgi:hypothetical protein
VCRELADKLSDDRIGVFERRQVDRIADAAKRLRRCRRGWRRGRRVRGRGLRCAPGEREVRGNRGSDEERRRDRERRARMLLRRQFQRRLVGRPKLLVPRRRRIDIAEVRSLRLNS